MDAIGERVRCNQESQLFTFMNTLILLLGIPTVAQWLDYPLGNTYVFWIVDACILGCMIKMQRQSKAFWPVYVWLAVIESAFVHGLFAGTNYWDYKLLFTNLLTFHLCLAAMTFEKPLYAHRILDSWFKYGWILLLLLAPIMGSDGFGKYLSPYTFLALFYPLLNWKLRVLAVVGLVLTFLFAFDSRSDVLKYTLCFLIGGIQYVQYLVKKSKYIVRLAHVSFLLLPLFLLSLAVTGVFNIFQLQEEFGIKEHTIQQSNGEDADALADTRTFLYLEELQSAIYNDYVLFGRSLARGYDNITFDTISDNMKGSHQGERASCEVNILNVFNYMGVTGCGVLFMVFVVSSFLAIYRTNNMYLPIIGMYVSFRWMFGFVEDFTRFDLNMFFLWAMIGMCLSPYFRRMNNRQFRRWIGTLGNGELEILNNASKQNRQKIALHCPSHVPSNPKSYQ